ncbi:hypothetical protein QQF64_031886 [Cirrhinus molitorella]|uniref:Uncharacterized protein n=1 Tax=Cirrhinus molitorella TaxID=172907 RepID=A0ABR3MY81_9TELE
MAENTDVNVIEKLRQSKDYPHNFNAEKPSVPIKEESFSEDNEVFCDSPKSTSVPVTEDGILDDLRFKCWCHEIFPPNKRPAKCSPGWDKSRNCVVSLNSFDSGYSSRKCTGIFSISELNNGKTNNDVTTSNKTSSTDISHH